MLNIKKNLWINNPVLFLSIRDDDYDTFVEKIFKNFSILDTPNVHGESLAHYCCYLGHIDKYYALINMGIEIKKTNKNDTLLHYASLGGRDNFLVTELVKEGTSPLDKNENGITPIHLCSDKTITSYFSLWLKINNISLNMIKDNFGNSIAHTAIQNGNKDIAEYWIHNDSLLNNSLNYEKKTPFEVSFKPYLVCQY